MNMKKYEKVKVEIILLKAGDIVTSSPSSSFNGEEETFEPTTTEE